MIDFEFSKKQRQSPVYKTIFLVGGIFFMGSALLRTFVREDFAFDSTFWLDVIYVLLGLLWILHALNVLNVPITGIVKIDDHRLYFNAPSFQKSVSVFWKDIADIEIEVTKLLIISKENYITKIELGWIPYNELITIKNEIEHIAENKNLTFQK